MAKKIPDGHKYLLPLLLEFLVLARLTMCFKEYSGSLPTTPAMEKLRLIHSWKSLDFAFGSDAARDSAIRSGKYRPGAALPIDVDVYYGKNDSKIFVTMPRLERGIPVTLGYVTNELSDSGDPLIAPYPDWHWNTVDDCDSLTSVYRIQIDECDRLWVLDAGVVGEHITCKPQLLSFSLKTNRLLSRYRFPDEQYQDRSVLVTCIVDVRIKPTATTPNSCHDTFVYVADVTTFSLIVYDHASVLSYRVMNNLFYPHPHYGTFQIQDETFDLMDGILGMTLGPIQADGDRILYFHSLASRTESRVPTSIIRNYTLFHDNPMAAPRAFEAFPMERSSQSAAEAMDRNGVLFFGLLSDFAIGCWNSKHFPQYGGRNIDSLVVNQHTLQFPSGLKVVTGPNGQQQLWVLTSSFHRYISGSLKLNETNFRIQVGSTVELVRGTKCDVNALDAYHKNLEKSSNRLPMTD